MKRGGVFASFELHQHCGQARAMRSRWVEELIEPTVSADEKEYCGCGRTKAWHQQPRQVHQVHGPAGSRLD